MRSRKGFWIVVFAIASIVMGVWLRSGSLIAISLPLIIYLVVSITMFRDPNYSLDVYRSIDESRVSKGDDIHVILHIQNTGPTIQCLEVEDVLPSMARLAEGSNKVIITLREEESFDLEYTINCPYRGRFKYLMVRVKARDFMDFYMHDVELKLVTEFSVISEIESSKGLKIAPRKTRNWIGAIKARRVGVGTEFFGIREYAAGDELRKINWKASARRDIIMTNEYEIECSGDVTIMLDARSETNVGNLDDNTVEHGVRAASTIASHILTEKNRVGLIVLRDIIDEVYPAFGKRQYYRVSEKLMDVQPGGSMPFDDARWMITKFFPLESQIIVISPLVDDKIVASIADLCARGFDVVVVSPNPITVEGGIIDPSPELEMAKGLKKLERENLISELYRYARVVDWDPSEPLAKALKGVERLRTRN
ncbi:MAG: DUF58 domain-containing protein [Thermoplasmata archaeon]|nr:DUF58 domain-containing protein [Thermoplasmata archaeon]